MSRTRSLHFISLSLDSLSANEYILVRHVGYVGGSCGNDNSACVYDREMLYGVLGEIYKRLKRPLQASLTLVEVRTTS